MYWYVEWEWLGLRFILELYSNHLSDFIKN